MLVIVGVFGGEYFGVSIDIKDVLFECVFFVLDYICGCVCSYGLYIDFLMCFECGVDYVL